MELEELQYCGKIRQWLADRYGSGADAIWQKTAQIYASWLAEVPDYGGKKNGHANAIYGGMLVSLCIPRYRISRRYRNWMALCRTCSCLRLRSLAGYSI